HPLRASALRVNSAPSLHDALPISDGYKQTAWEVAQEILTDSPAAFNRMLLADLMRGQTSVILPACASCYRREELAAALKDVALEDRKSTRLNSSHVKISYAVFCL